MKLSSQPDKVKGGFEKCELRLSCRSLIQPGAIHGRSEQPHSFVDLTRALAVQGRKWSLIHLSARPDTWCLIVMPYPRIGAATGNGGRLNWEKEDNHAEKRG